MFQYSILTFLAVALAFTFQVHAAFLKKELKEAKGMTAGSFNVTISDIEVKASAVKGVDVSTLISTSSASCFVGNGISSVTPRGYRSSGTLDPNICSSLTDAYQSGVKYRDTYLFPCPTCSKSAEAQVQELLNFINANCKTSFSGRVWLDIEGTQYWKGDTNANRVWYQSLVDACKKYADSCGIYTSKVQWDGIMGSSSYEYGSNLPLWYAHYDGKPDFSDFTAFGGWSTPYAKQYQGTTTFCSMGVDLNYIPNY